MFERLASLACVSVGSTLLHDGSELPIVVACAQVFFLSLIWFADAWSSLSGELMSFTRVDADTPPFLIRAFGWVGVLAMALVAIHLGCAAYGRGSC